MVEVWKILHFLLNRMWSKDPLSHPLFTQNSQKKIVCGCLKIVQLRRLEKCCPFHAAKLKNVQKKLPPLPAMSTMGLIFKIEVFP